MYPEMLYDGQKAKDPVTLDLYPAEQVTHFNLYEDDGVTREYKKGIFAETMIALQDAGGKTIVTVDPVKGEYKGMPATRHYVLQIHRQGKPKKVLLDGKKLKKLKSKAKWEKAGSGWYFDAAEKGGVLYVKTGLQEVKQGFEVKTE
jgi:hypothetical protein